MVTIVRLDAGATRKEQMMSQGETTCTSGPREPEDVAVAALRLLDEGDVDGVDRVFASDVLDHDPTPGVPEGIEGERALFAAVVAGFDDIRHEVEYQGRTGAGWVVTAWRMTGRHTGDFLGVPATGRALDFKGMKVQRGRDGKLVEPRHVEQLLQLVQQVQG